MDLLTIGQSARLTSLTVRQPACVDPDTGYRYFSTDQVSDAAAIRRLRFLKLALDEIREILEADDAAFTRARLVQHRAKMAELAATTEQILASLQRIIEGEEELVPAPVDISDDIEIKDVPDQPVLRIRERVPAEELKHVIPAAFKEIAKYLHGRGLEPIGPPITLCPYADEEGMVAVENTSPVASEVPRWVASRRRRCPRAPFSRTGTSGTTRSWIAHTERSRRWSNGEA